MWKISSAILLSIPLFILAFPNNNKATNQLGLKKIEDIKLASPAVVQTNIPPALKQSKKPNLLKSVALATMLATGAMVGHNSHNNLMERNGGTAGHLISKNGTNNGGLMERVRGYYENLKNANIVSSKTNGKGNWPSKMDKGNIAKFGVGWSEHVKNLGKMYEMGGNEWNHFDGKKLNAGQEEQTHNHNQWLIGHKEKDNGIGLMNKIKNISLNSTKKLKNYFKQSWIDEHINQIDIEIGANIGEEMAKNVIKIGEIMKKILEINVNVKIDSMKNENGKNDGFGIQLKLHNWRTGSVESREIKIPLLFDKHGKLEMNSLELGRELIRQICGGNECDQRDDLPEFGANPCSTKPPPELHELDRSLRSMLLKLSSKLNTGRLWTDNPIPDYKNGFYVGFDWEIESDLTPIDSGWLPLLKAQLECFEENAPIRFLELQNGNIESAKFKNRLHFVIQNGKSLAKNGLQRNEEKNVVYLNAKELEESESIHLIQETLLEALGVNAGEGLRIEYDRRDKYMPELRRKFAQLNAAYGAENYAIQGQPFMLFKPNWRTDNPRIIDKPEVEFWMGQEYANFATRKYEIPVVYDDDFKEIANQNQKLLEEVYANFAKNSVIQFVVYEEAPKNKNYVRIYRADDDYAVTAFVGRTIKRDPSYEGEPVKFGKDSMDKYTLYHEFMHVAGMEHEHQRADVEQHLGFDRQKAQNMWSYDNMYYAINFAPNLTYLPLNEYNPRSIMHYNLNWECFQLKGEIDRKNQELPSEPDQMDWENLNHFYGVGKGRTQFKVEIDENGQQKIVDDIDGMRRLKK